MNLENYSVKQLSLICFAIWIIAIGGLIGYNEYIFDNGQTVLLKPVPVDPWDMFRGEHVILNYNISTVDISLYYDEYIEPEEMLKELEKEAAERFPIEDDMLFDEDLDPELEEQLIRELEKELEFEELNFEPRNDYFMEEVYDYFYYDDDIYVYLKQDGKYWVIDYISKQKKDGFYIKGKVENMWGKTLILDYGIGSYFVEEGNGKFIEKNYNHLDVEVVVASNGVARIKTLYVNETEVR